MFKCDRFSRSSDSQISLVKAWWKEKVHSDLESSVLSDYGFMVSSDVRPVAAVFLYPIIGCDTALVGFPISNPLASREERQEALSFLVSSVEAEAKKMRYDYLISYAGSNGAVELFNRSGYAVADRDVVNFVKKIEEI